MSECVCVLYLSISRSIHICICLHVLICVYSRVWKCVLTHIHMHIFVYANTYSRT